MIERLKDHIFRSRLFDGNQRILLTVSGGVDSMVMADLFSKMEVNIGIAHCNFKLRGEESNKDENFVRSVAKAYNIPIYVKCFDTADFALANKLSIQVAARELRYKWFEELIDENEFDLYATAHHLDDQIETFFINLFRGTGVSGLRGFPAKNGNCIRPLLFAHRDMIAKYAFANKIKFREDGSNIKDDYLRNRIRHHVLPALEQSESSFRKGFQSTFQFLADTEKFVKHEISVKKADFFEEINGLQCIKIKKIKQDNNAAFVLFELLRPLNFNYAATCGILESLGTQSGKKFFSSTNELVIDREYLIISEIANETCEVYEVNENTSKIVDPISIKFQTLSFDKSQPILGSNKIACFDRDRITFPMKLRKYCEGDKFQPLGMKGQKKLSDFFIDQKLSLPEKREVWLLLSGDEIVWIIGLRIDDRYKITGKTKNILKASLI